MGGDGSSEAAAFLRGWDTVPDEELRLAVVLNGGVSLAVWMGGVAHEINRLTWSVVADEDGRRTGPRSGPGTHYGPILDLVRSTCIADVITGTSAGGINGAALALGQVNRSADLRVMRALWSDQGRMEALLRPPFRGQPSSLLRGDDYFLPELGKAMSALSSNFDRSSRVVDLTMNTTLLDGAVRTTTDGLGQVLIQREHAARFRFRSDSTDRPFEESSILGTASALALAARASASFPVAFEPTFVPVRRDRADGPGSTLAGGRPDMARFAAWAQGRAGDLSRFAVDGGVLANTPTREAMRAIDARPARGPMRRQMLLVYPHAPGDRSESVSRAEAPPTVLGALNGVVGALVSQGSLTFVQEVEEHNRRAGSVRGGRVDLLRSLAPARAVAPSPGPAAGPEATEERGLPALYRLVGLTWRHYRELRQRLAAGVLATSYVEAGGREGWSFERIRQAAEAAQDPGVDASSQPVELGYVPRLPPPTLRSLGLRSESSIATWPWGVTVALGVADSAADILRRALSIASASERPELVAARRAVSQARTGILAARDLIDDSWRAGGPFDGLEPNESYWKARLLVYRRAMTGVSDPEQDEAALAGYLAACGAGTQAQQRLRTLLTIGSELGQEVAGHVWAAVAALEGVRAHILALDDARQQVAELSDWLWLLDDDRLGEPADLAEPRDATLRLLMRLLALDTATWLVSDNGPTDSALPVQLAQLSLAVPHDFAALSTSPEDKAAGTAFNRFGGFLKRSWRINDWIWGRLDAAELLCKLVLDPARIQRIAAVTRSVHGDPGTDPAKALLDALERHLYGTTAWLDERHRLRKEKALAELTELLRGQGPRPSELPRLAAFAAYALQMRIILEELPFLVAAIRSDRVEGANPRSNGEVFLEREEALLARVNAWSPSQGGSWRDLGSQALAAFDRCGVGREDLRAEAGSDTMIRTAANAAGVAATLIDSPRVGVSVLKPITRVVRGAAMVPYWLLTGLTRGPGLARLLAQFGFLVGGVLFTLGLLGLLGTASSAAAGVGLAILLAGFAYAALRTGGYVHGIALLGPVVPLLAYAGQRLVADTEPSPGDRAFGTVVIVVGVALGLALIASIPWPLHSPQHSTGLLIRRRRAARTGTELDPRSPLSRREASAELARALLPVAATLAVLVIAWLLIWQLGSLVLEGLRSREEPEVDALVVLAVGVVLMSVAAWVGGWVSHRQGAGLRVWRELADDPEAGPGASRRIQESPVQDPSGVAAGWTVVYGVVYLAAATLLALWLAVSPTEPVWAVASTAWFLLLGIVFTLVTPWLVPSRARHAVRQGLADAVRGEPVSDSAEFLDLLDKRGQRYAYLCVLGEDGRLGLSPAGDKLLRSLRQPRGPTPAEGAGPANAAGGGR